MHVPFYKWPNLIQFLDDGVELYAMDKKYYEEIHGLDRTVALYQSMACTWFAKEYSRKVANDGG